MNTTKKTPSRERTRKQRAEGMMKILLNGPELKVSKDMFTECLLRRDFGSYIECEINRTYKEWFVNNIFKDLKILIPEVKQYTFYVRSLPNKEINENTMHSKISSK